MGIKVDTSERAYILEVLGEASRVVQEIPVSGYMRIGRGSEVTCTPEIGPREMRVLELDGPAPFFVPVVMLVLWSIEPPLGPPGQKLPGPEHRGVVPHYTTYALPVHSTLSIELRLARRE